MEQASPDHFDLTRFVDAQADVFDTALAELRAGRKVSHWMWFIFPQVEGLGSSAMARRYAIRSKAEAVAYLRHRVLGPRLRECAEALLQVRGRTAEQIMGYPDYIKLKSSMTLFAAVSEAGSLYERVLGKYFAGGRDEQTVRFIATDRP